MKGFEKKILILIEFDTRYQNEFDKSARITAKFESRFLEILSEWVRFTGSSAITNKIPWVDEWNVKEFTHHEKNLSFKFVLFSKTPQTVQNKKLLHFGQIVNFVLNLQDREQI